MVNHIIEDGRELALQRALALPLADAVFEVVRYNMWGETFASPIELSELSSMGNKEEIEDWSVRSLALLRSGYKAGTALLRNDGTYPEARKRLELDHPGFGDTSYAWAVDRGAFEAR